MSSSVAREIGGIIDTWRRCGTATFLACLLDKLLAVFSPSIVLVIRMHPIRELANQPRAVPAGYALRDPTPAELHEFAARYPAILSQKFIEEALGKGDRCTGVFFGPDLVAFQWFARSPTQAFGRLYIDVDHRFVYAYKAETLPAHRGKRLHGAALALGAANFLAEGVTGLAAYIRGHNTSSLLSGIRLGSPATGFAVVWNPDRSESVWMSKFCREIGLRVLTPEGPLR
ncbi:MAG: hypothetical protein RLZZ200_2175 [Pseudomonadota bacterium]|jgi:hypothetical protein